MSLPQICPADRAELSALVNAYAYAVDARDTDLVASLFIADGVLVVPVAPEGLTPTREIKGIEAITAELAKLADFIVTSHAIVGHHLLESDDGSARGMTRCVAHHISRRTTGELRDLVWNLRYADNYRRTDNGWQFARRELTIDFLDVHGVRDASQRLGR